MYNLRKGSSRVHALGLSSPRAERGSSPAQGHLDLVWERLTCLSYSIGLRDRHLIWHTFGGLLGYSLGTETVGAISALSSAFLHLGVAIFLSFPFLLSFPPSLPHPLLCSSQSTLFFLKTKQTKKPLGFFLSFFLSFLFFLLSWWAHALLHSPSASFELVGTIFVLSLCCTPEHQYLPEVSFYSIWCPCFTSGALFLWLLPFFTV